MAMRAKESEYASPTSTTPACSYGDSSSATRKVTTCSTSVLRRTFLADKMDLDGVDLVVLAKADRRKAEEHLYRREFLVDGDLHQMKLRWRQKQVKRFSNSAQLFGPRESIRAMWDFIQGELGMVASERSKSMDTPRAYERAESQLCHETKQAVPKKGSTVEVQAANCLPGSASRSFQDTYKAHDGSIVKLILENL